MTSTTPTTTTMPTTPSSPPPRRGDHGPGGRSRAGLATTIGAALHGLRARPGRAVMTALGVAIGIASLVAVVGISASARADVIAQIDELGTDLLAVQAGQDLFGDEATLPVAAPGMVRRIGAVSQASSQTTLNAAVRRSELDTRDNGVDVLASETNLLDTVRGRMAAGRWSDGRSPATVVLGHVAAERLGITSLEGSPTVTVAGRRFVVVGILESLPLHPDLDRSALIDMAAAEEQLGAELVPTRMLVRTMPSQVAAVRDVLARTVNPGSPNEVTVSRPSDALEARAAVDEGLQRLLLGLGGVALLAGGIGIANVMVVAVLERRGEIGLRRAIGARRRHIVAQFVLESVLLATLGGAVGVGLGAAITGVYAAQQGWTTAVPVAGLAGAVALSVLLGALAGLHPAVRAARLDPVAALRR